jgi:hypothetical protein
METRLTLRWPAALAASPRFCTSSRSLANSAMRGGIPPPRPSGEACGTATIDAVVGAAIGEAGARSPGHGAGVPTRGASVGHGMVCAAAWWAARRHPARREIPVELCDTSERYE